MSTASAAPRPRGARRRRERGARRGAGLGAGQRDLPGRPGKWPVHVQRDPRNATVAGRGWRSLPCCSASFPQVPPAGKPCPPLPPSRVTWFPASALPAPASGSGEGRACEWEALRLPGGLRAGSAGGQLGQRELAWSPALLARPGGGLALPGSSAAELVCIAEPCARLRGSDGWGPAAFCRPASAWSWHLPALVGNAAFCESPTRKINFPKEEVGLALLFLSAWTPM